MTARFRSRVEPAEITIELVERRLLGGRVPVLWAKWREAAPERATVRHIDALVDRGVATATEAAVLLPARAAAELPADIAEAIDLPPLAELGLAVALDGRIEQPDGRLQLRWTDRWKHQVSVVRNGIVVTSGLKSGRLSARLFAVVEAAEGYNASVGQPLEQRVAAWLPMQQALAGATNQEIARDGFLETFTLYQAGAFALDLRESDDFAPVLMSRAAVPSLEDDAPAEDMGLGLGEDGVGTGRGSPPAADSLLPPAEQRSFLDAFAGEQPTRDAYRVGRNSFVLIDPALKPVLDVVRSKRSAGETERKAFLRNPRAAIAEAFASLGREAPPASLFVETSGYSDRVAGLGLWERPKIPWITKILNDWLSERLGPGATTEAPLLSREELDTVIAAYEAAEARGYTEIVVGERVITIDAVAAFIDRERKRIEAAEAAAAVVVEQPTAARERTASERLVLVVAKSNLDGVDYELALTPRRALVPAVPPVNLMGLSPLKPHQEEGFAWMVGAWVAGWPGILLADDMGLGKTYQALAFMAWLRGNALAARHLGVGSQAEGPMLVVAPTALLRNWEKEYSERLLPGALGQLEDAYGSGLKRLRLAAVARADQGETLDRRRLRDAGCILTTYETLTDHERAFGPIRYSLVLFDEMQKIKAPDTLNTKAAKALNADFVIGLTGTPIENRLEDIWCLFDRIAPGYLADLKSFSAIYRQDQPERLKELKRRLDQPGESHPPPMKRRMKADILTGLPQKVERVYPTPMPDAQADAYRALVGEAKRHPDRSQGFMLKVLHGMRGISLHPTDPEGLDLPTARSFEAFARKSARLSTTLSILRDIRSRGEKALVFIEFLAMQRAVADGLAALFDLPRRPSIISGEVPGERRLAIVEAFSTEPGGFGVLILSPRAAGLGLNITAANHVIHLSRWWNPAVEDQCNDRAYRIGQERDVTIHIPIATHPDFPGASFDEKLHQLLERKRALSRDMLAPPTGPSDVTDLFGDTVPGVAPNRPEGSVTASRTK